MWLTLRPTVYPAFDLLGPLLVEKGITHSKCEKRNNLTNQGCNN